MDWIGRHIGLRIALTLRSHGLGQLLWCKSLGGAAGSLGRRPLLTGTFLDCQKHV